MSDTKIRHIAWFDFLGGLIGQKTIKAHCGVRVVYGQHTNDAREATCLECIHHVAQAARFIERMREDGHMPGPTRDDSLYA